MGTRDEIVVGLDVGTRSVRAVVAEMDDKGLQITGIGTAPSKGARAGNVMNVDSTSTAVHSAVSEAARMAGIQVGRVLASVGGDHLQGVNSQGVVAIKGDAVTRDDRDRVLETAGAVKPDSGREFLQLLPQQYLVDDIECVDSPCGTTGVRLEARVHLITAATARLENLRRAVQQAGLDVEEVAACGFAASEAVLEDTEKELGVAMVDIGAGTTDIAIWFDHALVYTAVVPLGGNHITSDIAAGLRTPKVEAERIKCTHGCATSSEVDEDDIFEVASFGGREPSQQGRQFLAEIIEPRIAEILEHVRDHIEASHCVDHLTAGVVLAGGTAKLAGLVPYAEEVLGMPVRIGRCLRVGGLKDMVAEPEFATAVGLCAHGVSGDDVVHLYDRTPGRNRGVLGLIREAVRRVASIFF